MKGRKPAPISLKLLKGDGRPSRLNKNAPEFKAATIDPPVYVTGLAREKWLEVAPQLHGAGVLRQINLTTLARYCMDWERYIAALRHVDENGEFYTTEGGLLKRNPAGAAASELSRLLLALEVEFGMTPSAAGRVTSQAPTAAADEGFA